MPVLVTCCRGSEAGHGDIGGAGGPCSYDGACHAFGSRWRNQGTRKHATAQTKTNEERIARERCLTGLHGIDGLSRTYRVPGFLVDRCCNSEQTPQRGNSSLRQRRREYTVITTVRTTSDMNLRTVEFTDTNWGVKALAALICNHSTLSRCKGSS